MDRLSIGSVIRCRHTLANAVERITVPVSVRKRRDAKQRKNKHSFIERNAVNSQLIISCKRKEFNHFRDNRYIKSPNEEIPLKFLASGGWLHYKSKGDYFNINAHAKQNHLDKKTTFASLGLSTSLTDVLQKEMIQHPSHIQVETIPTVLEMSNVVCAAETGCGKTLAYLLPIIQRLLQYKDSVDTSALATTSPLAVVIMPSRELAEQVANVAKTYCEPLGLTALNLSQGSTTNRLISSLRAKVRDVHVLVATPGSLAIGLRSNAISPALVSHVIIDEADTLMDESFNKDTVNLLSQLAAKPAGILGMQIVLASATLPTALNSILGNTISAAGFVQCTTGHLHHMLAHVSQKFIRLGHTDKPDELVRMTSAVEDTPTMVFVKGCSTATFLNDLLLKNSIPHLTLHGALNGEERKGRFLEYQEGSCNLLICSDVASRGLDTLRVSHVINYDFPRLVSDYIHRVGRVGRLGSHNSGKVTNFVGHRPEVDLVWKIERAVRSNRNIAELPDVNNRVKQISNTRKSQERSRSKR